MLYATNHNKTANKVALLAAHRAMYFDQSTDLSDAHLNADSYVSIKVKSVKAWGNSLDTAAASVMLSPMSGAKAGFYYPARSARLVVTSVDNSDGYLGNTRVQTSQDMIDRYFTVYDKNTVGQWTGTTPVFTGQTGPSVDTSTDRYWPSGCMLVIPAGVRKDSIVQSYSSLAGVQYSRTVDSFWHTFSGYDAGYNCASLRFSIKAETNVVGYNYIHPTTTPVQNIPIHADGMTEDHIVFIRPVSKTYSYSGLNQFSSTFCQADASGVAGYTRGAASFPLRVATNAADTQPITLSSGMMAFKVNGFGYLLRLAQSDLQVQSDVQAGADSTVGISTNLMPDISVINL